MQTKFFSIIAALFILAASCVQRQNKTQALSIGDMSAEAGNAGVIAETDKEEIALGSPVKPSQVGEFIAPDDDPDDDSYPYRAAPDGKYFHFEGFVSDGDTPWDTFRAYEEVFTSSSTLPPSGVASYGAENLRNDRYRDKGGGVRATAWVEGVAGYGVGERVTMSVKTKAQIEGQDDEIRFRSLLVVNGYAKDATTWKNNSRVKILRLFVGEIHWCDLHLDDIIKPQIFHFPDNLYIYPAKSGRKIPEQGKFAKPSDYEDEDWSKTPVYQTDLTFEIIEVYRGERFDDTCITGIALDVMGGIY